MVRFLEYLVIVAAIASLAPFVIPDGRGGRLFSRDTLSVPDLDLPWVVW